MILDLKVINSDATLNNFFYLEDIEFVPGTPLKFLIQVIRKDLPIRFIPEVGATITCDFLKSDGTTLTKSGSFKFADDRSILEFSLTDVETTLLIGQNITVTIEELASEHVAILKSGLKVAFKTGGC